MIPEFNNLSPDEAAQRAWVMGMESAPLYARLAELEKEVEDYDDSLEKARNDGYQEGYDVAKNTNYEAEITALNETVTHLKVKLKDATIDLDRIREWLVSDKAKTVASRKAFANWIATLKAARYL